MKKNKEIKELSISEIQIKLKEEHDEQMNLRLKNATGQMGKPHLIKEKRRSIARFETFLRLKK